jgi:sec-independent protein translocase protein TatC
MADLVDSVRAAVSDRAELPGMSLMEHLTELRKRLIHSTLYLLVGFCVAYAFHVRLYSIIQKPLNDLHIALNYTHPTDPLNLYLKTALYGGIILASPFILYQFWLFIAPGMYANEKRYVVPFMTATIVLFLSGAWFGYHWVFPGALKVLIGGFGKNFNPVLTIEDYTNFFLAVILALFGIVDAKFLVQHIRYAILAIFIIAAIICPTPDPIGMCLFASPMLVLYLLGVGVAFLVHPARRKAREEKKAA